MTELGKIPYARNRDTERKRLKLELDQKLIPKEHFLGWLEVNNECLSWFSAQAVSTNFVPFDKMIILGSRSEHPSSTSGGVQEVTQGQASEQSLHRRCVVKRGE